MSQAIIEIQDEVNVKFRGLSSDLIERAKKTVTWTVPGFAHMPMYRAGRWDGTISLMSNTGKTYLNLLDRMLPMLEAAGVEFEIEDNRQDWSDVVDQIVLPDQYIFSEHTWDGTPDGEPIVLRDYQLDAVHAALLSGQGLLEMATGAGKTITCATLSKIYSQFGKVIVLVPSIDLAIQTQAVFKKVGLDAGIWYSELKDARQITISTWQSMDHFPELMAGVVCVIVDEAHQAKAKTIGEIMTGPACNVPFRFGCTGTVPKEDLSRNQIAGAIGTIIFTLSAWELQQRGVLASSVALQINMKDSLNNRYRMAPAFDDWAEQLDWQFSDPDRVAAIVSILIDYAENEGNTLVFVPNKEHGKILERAIPGSVSLDGDDKPTKRQKYYKWFNDNDNNVLICTYGIASTGLDIPRINVLGFIEPGKKFEKIIQSIGRGLRKAEDKDHVTLLDFCGDTDFSKKHAASRRKLYKDAHIICHIEDFDYANS